MTSANPKFFWPGVSFDVALPLTTLQGRNRYRDVPLEPSQSTYFSPPPSGKKNYLFKGLFNCVLVTICFVTYFFTSRFVFPLDRGRIWGPNEESIDNWEQSSYEMNTK